jgi:hypothetical protein
MCGYARRDPDVVHRHFIHRNDCQFTARSLAFARQRLVQEEQELQRTLILQLDSSTAVEVDVPYTSTRLPSTVPLPQQDAFGEAPAGMPGLPSEQEPFSVEDDDAFREAPAGMPDLPSEQENFSVEDDDFPLAADDEMEYGDDDFGDGDGGMEHDSSHVEASDDAVNEFGSSSVQSEDDFDTALDATWTRLKDVDRMNEDFERDCQWEDDSSDMLELEEKGGDGYLSDTSEEELPEPEERALEQMDASPFPVNFPTGIEPPPPNQEDDDVQVEALLLALVQQFGCSLDGYQTIMEWAAFAQEKGYKFGRVERQKSRRAVMQRMIKRLDMECLKPISKTIPLVDDPGPDLDASRRGDPAPSPIPKKSIGVPSIPIVMYNFEDLLDSILKDKTLMVLENLLLNPENPYGKYPDGGPLNDVLSGSWYHQTWVELNLGDGDFLCPIIFFIDKTHTDHFGRFTLEPIRFTLGIFNRATRALSKAWRTLGFLTDLQKGSTAQNTRNRVRTTDIPTRIARHSAPTHSHTLAFNKIIPLFFSRLQISKTTTELQRSS